MDDVAGGLEPAYALAAVGRWDGVRDALLPVLAQDPENAAALCLLAESHGATGRLDEALIVAERAVAVGPQDPETHSVRAAALRALGRWADAVESSTEHVRLAPDWWGSHAGLALSLNGEPATRQDAWLAAVRAVDLAPGHPEAHFVVGLVAGGLGWTATAVRAYQRVLRLDPQHAGARNNLAVLDLADGRIAEAATGFRAVLRADPASGVARGNVEVAGWALLRDLAVAAFGGTWVVALLVASDDHTGGPGLLRLLAAPLLVLAYGHLAHRVLGRIPADLRTSLLRLPRRDRAAGVAAGGTGLAVSASVLAAVLPFAPARVALAMAMAGVWVAAVALWSWSPGRQT